jgi:hypothetical protein
MENIMPSRTETPAQIQARLDREACQSSRFALRRGGASALYHYKQELAEDEKIRAAHAPSFDVPVTVASHSDAVEVSPEPRPSLAEQWSQTMSRFTK